MIGENYKCDFSHVFWGKITFSVPCFETERERCISWWSGCDVRLALEYIAHPSSLTLTWKITLLFWSNVLISSYALIGLHVSLYMFHLINSGHITWISIKIHFTRTLPKRDGSKCVKDIKLFPLHSPSLILFELGRSLTLFWNHIFLGTL